MKSLLLKSNKDIIMIRFMSKITTKLTHMWEDFCFHVLDRFGPITETRTYETFEVNSDK